MDEPDVPLYGQRTVAEILPAVAHHLGVPGYRDTLGLADALSGVGRVVVLLVDGLGRRQIDGHRTQAPTLGALPDLAARTGVAHPAGAPLTSGFPSTTPVSLVSLGTGQAPAEHGVIGFTVAIPGTGRTLNHIHWSRDVVDPRVWQPNSTVLGRTASAGVPVTVVGPGEFAATPLTDAAYRGGTYTGAYTPGDLVAIVAGALRAAPRALVYAYVSTLDAVAHRRGLASAAWGHELALVDLLVARLVAALPGDAALLVTADHGLIDVPEEARVDVDAVPELQEGVTLLAGEPRARYVHARPGAAADVHAAWAGVLGDRAWVRHRDEAVAAGWFGPPGTVRADVLGRIGDVVAAARDTSAVVASRTDPLTAALVAYHGSFLPAEVEIPLLLARGESV